MPRVVYLRRTALFFDQELTHLKGQEGSATQKIIERFPEMPGCTVTFDALHTNHKTMEKIVVEKKLDESCAVYAR